jgi:hypothetical protein
MASNKLQIKRTTVSGRTPNTTNSGNSQYISTGELALNLADSKLFTSDGTNLIDLTPTGGSSSLTVRSTNGNGGTVNTTVSGVTGINFDDSTGLHVTSQGSGNVFVSLGSGYKYITVSGQTTITAVGEDTLNVANGQGIVLTTSNTAPKTLTIASTGYVNADVQYTWTNTHNYSIGANAIALTNGTSNWIYWTGAGTAAPTFTTRSAGTKVVLYPTLGASQVDYALGINSGTLWSSIPGNDAGQFFKWYGGETEVASLSGTGNLLLNGSVNAAAHTVGSSWVANTSGVYMTMPLSANGGVGTGGQVLTSNGSTGAPYWSTVSGGGGGASVTVSDTAPASPTSGALWYYTVTGELFVYYNDGDSSQWVTAASAATPSIVPNATNANNAAYLGGVAAANYASTGKAIAMAIVFGG